MITNVQKDVLTLDAFAQKCMPTKSPLSCLLHLGDEDQTSHPHPLPSTVIPSSSDRLSFLALFSFMPSHSTPSSLLQLFCLLWVMPDNDLSCKLLPARVNLFMCLRACVYFLHPTPPTTPADHLLAAFFLLPLFVSSFSFGTLPLREAEKTVWMSYAIARIAVALRYHV